MNTQRYPQVGATLGYRDALQAAQAKRQLERRYPNRRYQIAFMPLSKKWIIEQTGDCEHDCYASA